MVSFAASAEIRDSICIIKPQIVEANKKLYGEIALAFKRAGSDEFSSEFQKDIDAEIFGSGFLVKATDGSVWVITNRHVVQNALQAKLTFEVVRP